MMIQAAVTRIPMLLLAFCPGVIQAQGASLVGPEGELTGSAVATHLVGYLLNGYGEDPRVTEERRDR